MLHYHYLSSLKLEQQDFRGRVAVGKHVSSESNDRRKHNILNLSVFSAFISNGLRSANRVPRYYYMARVRVRSKVVVSIVGF